ncbi:transforming acidic coiled-coil-containing protein 3 isoform X2 [Choloepus didactylus]|nr:transforming acidic coiled-coil-containing protein 3 isoform X2 [Choloepus didactylus]
MSLQILNDENVTGDKATESRDFLFSPPELTRRSSVLRLSQKENVPPKSIARAMKVTFQTPLRNPQTHRILSPRMTGKLEAPFALDETVGLADSDHGCTERDHQQLTKDVDAGTNNRAQQQAKTDAVPPSEATEPAGTGGSQDSSLAPLSDRASAGSSCVLEGLEDLATSPGRVSGSPEKTLDEITCCYSLDKSITCTSENLEDGAGTGSLEGTEKPPGAAEGSLDCWVSSAEAILPPGGLQGETLPADLSNEAPACPEDTCTPREEEQRPLASTAGDTEAPGTPVPTGAAQPPHILPPSPSSGAQQEEGTGQAAASSQSELVRLEIGFSDHPAGRKVPPPRGLGKRPSTKPPALRPETRQEKSPRKAGEEGEHPVSVPQGSYNLDWDKLDDPNFSPFNRGSQCAGGEAQPLPTTKQLGAGPAATGDTAPSQQVVPAPADDTPEFQMADETPQAAGKEGTAGLMSNEPAASPTQPLAQPPMQGPTSDPAMETFRDPTEVLGSGAEVDYLEQFGTSSFQESALRKQSLYLKFDPLLRDSPCRVVPTVAKTRSVPEAGEPPSAGLPLARLEEVDLLGALDVPVPGLDPCVLGPGGLSLPSMPIVDMLQYTQKDLDVAVRASQVESQQLRSRCEELHEKNQVLGKIMDEFERVAHQTVEDARKQKELDKAELQKALKKISQLTADLNSLEKSFSDLFKRFEKQREALEGYRKNEEALKKCAEDYILRIEQEGQRYQALKAHAEEKLQLANEEMAQFRSKSQSEALALQASLRKEQMRSHSLERTVEQKAKEIDELTRICDDLISKMKKI